MLRRIIINLLWWLFFKPRGRKIFSFHDGVRWRRSDPMEVYRGFAEHPEFNWETDPVTLAHAGDGIIPESAVLKASARMATAVRQVLEIPPVEEGGLTEAECAELYSEFVSYVNAVKKNSSPTPTGPESTDPQDSGGSATKPGSDSLSISAGNVSGEVTSPGTESTGQCMADPVATPSTP